MKRIVGIVILMAGAAWGQYYPTVRTMGSVTTNDGVVFADNSGRFIKAGTVNVIATNILWNGVLDKPFSLLSELTTTNLTGVNWALFLQDFSTLTGADIAAAGGLTNAAAFDAAGSSDTVQSNLTAHIADTNDAHDASAISTTNTAFTTAQDGFNLLAGITGAVTSVQASTNSAGVASIAGGVLNVGTNLQAASGSVSYLNDLADVSTNGALATYVLGTDDGTNWTPRAPLTGGTNAVVLTDGGTTGTVGQVVSNGVNDFTLIFPAPGDSSNTLQDVVNNGGTATNMGAVIMTGELTTGTNMITGQKFGQFAGEYSSGYENHSFGFAAGGEASGDSWHSFGYAAGAYAQHDNSIVFGRWSGINARGNNRGYFDVYSDDPNYDQTDGTAGDGATNDTIFLDSTGVLYLGGGPARAENPSAGVVLRGPVTFGGESRTNWPTDGTNQEYTVLASEVDTTPGYLSTKVVGIGNVMVATVDLGDGVLARQIGLYDDVTDVTSVEYRGSVGKIWAGAATNKIEWKDGGDAAVVAADTNSRVLYGIDGVTHIDFSTGYIPASNVSGIVSVSSVNGATGVVVLAASDVGAVATGSTITASTIIGTASRIWGSDGDGAADEIEVGTGLDLTAGVLTATGGAGGGTNIWESWGTKHQALGTLAIAASGTQTVDIASGAYVSFSITSTPVNIEMSAPPSTNYAWPVWFEITHAADATSRTCVWSTASFRLPGGTQPVLSQNTSNVDRVKFIYSPPAAKWDLENVVRALQ